MRCGWWATGASDRTTRDPGRPGVRPHCTCSGRAAYRGLAASGSPRVQDPVV
ncbi:DUF6207 family protein [Streptomyces sp. NPDC005483]|uniref:DUF6207 family protein n=1 Tax=Streptomyces sp. NPDC005483 TaxID=3154882 RepID=UPI0033B6B49A